MGKMSTKHKTDEPSVSFSDTILESSNADGIIDYLRLKRNLVHQPKELFSNLNNVKPRKSYPLQINSYENQNDIIARQDNVLQKTNLQNESNISNVITSEYNICTDNEKNNNSPKKIRLPRVLLHKDVRLENYPNARKALDFEMTIQQNDFQPILSSTPLSDNPSVQNKLSYNSNTNRTRKKSELIQNLKSLTSAELAASNLIKQLEHEKIVNNNKNNLIENNQETEDDDTLIENNINNEKSNEGIEDLEENNIDMNLIENAISSSPLQNKQIGRTSRINSIQNEKSKASYRNKSFAIPDTEEVPETEEYEVENVTIPETQESDGRLEKSHKSFQHLSVSKNKNVQELNKSNKEERILPVKSPNRRTFTVHRFELVKTLASAKSQFINNENNLSPNPLRIVNTSQMSPLARRALSQSRVEMSAKKKESKIPRRISVHQSRKQNKTIDNSPIKNNQSVKYIEKYPESLSKIVIPIYQTVNVSKDVPIVSSVTPEPIASPKIQPPIEFCDKTIIQNEKSINLGNNSKNNVHTDQLIISNERLELPSPSVGNEVLTDDEDFVLPSTKLYLKSSDNQQALQSSTTFLRNNTILQNKSLNETEKAVDLRTRKRLSKRKSSVTSNPLKKKMRVLLKKLSIEQNTENQMNNDLLILRKNVLLTPRYTPPPTLILSDDELIEENDKNQENISKISTKKMSSINTDRYNNRTSNYNHRSKSINSNVEFRSESLLNQQNENSHIYDSHKKSSKNISSKTRNKSKKNLTLSKNVPHSINKNDITSKTSNKSVNFTNSFVNVTDIQIEHKISNNLSNKRNENEQKSPILSRHATLSYLKIINFNRINQLEKPNQINIDKSVDQQKSIHKEKSSSRSSSQSESSNSNNIEDNNNQNLDIVIDNPKAMTKFWKKSIENTLPKVLNKRDQENDTLKDFYLNVGKTINTSSTSSGRRKLYSKGQSDIDMSPLRKPNNKKKSSNESLGKNINNKSQFKPSTNQIIDNIRADLNNINNSVLVDDQNPNHTANEEQVYELNSNSSNNKNEYEKKKNIDNATNNNFDNIFKKPNLPVPKSLHKKKQSNNKKKPIKNINSDSSSHFVTSTQFGTPRRTSTKLAVNIDEDLVDTTTTVRRSQRRRCPRIEYWTNEGRILSNPFADKEERVKNNQELFKKLRKNIRRKKDLKNVQLTENNNISSTIIKEKEIEPQQTSIFNEQLSQLVDIITENLSTIDNHNNNNKEILPDNNKTNKKKTKSNKKEIKIKKPITENNNNNNIKIIEPIPSTSKEITASIPSTSHKSKEVIIPPNPNNYDSGNGSDAYNANGSDGFLWLKKLVNSNSSSMIVERLITGKEFELASFNCMSDVEKDGVQYYLSSTTNAQNFGFIKLRPNATKKISKLKHNDINFILFSDELHFNIAGECLENTKAGQVVFIKRDKKYSISNKTDADGVLLFIKTQ